MEDNYIMYKGKRYELTEDQFKSLGIREDPFDIQDNDTYYYIDTNGTVMNTMYLDYVDGDRRDRANACKDRNLLSQRALHEWLDRLLWRFSMQHDGDKINVYNSSRYKYYIRYDPSTMKYYVESYMNLCTLGSVLFYSQEICQQAIDDVLYPFIQAHPEYSWNYNLEV